MQQTTNQSPIDLVYLWCDMSDEQWNANRKEVAKLWPELVRNDKEAVSRYQSHDELRYSIRSAEMYAPWIRNIIIVVSDDNALPVWLNTDNPRLRIVRHSEIIPAEYLPTYNSVTMEHFISRIPGLSEKFLFANDDMFFFNHVTPEYFFDENDEPIKRVLGDRFGINETRHYCRTLSNAAKLIMEEHKDINRETVKLLFFHPHHNIDAYRKSHNLTTFEKYKSAILPDLSIPFRKDTNIQRIIYLMEEVVTYGAETIIEDETAASSSLHFMESVWQQGLNEALRLRPKLLCFNAMSDNCEDHYAWLRLAMDVIYPVRSSFEKS